MTGTFIAELCSPSLTRYGCCVIIVDGDCLSRSCSVCLEDDSNIIVRIYNGKGYIVQRPWLRLRPEQFGENTIPVSHNNWIGIGLDTMLDEKAPDGQSSVHIVITNKYFRADALHISCIELQNAKLCWLNREIDQRLLTRQTGEMEGTTLSIGQRLRAAIGTVSQNKEEDLYTVAEPQPVTLIKLRAIGLSLLTFPASGYFNIRDKPFAMLNETVLDFDSSIRFAILSLSSRVPYMSLLKELNSSTHTNTITKLYPILSNHVISYSPLQALRDMEASEMNDVTLLAANEPFYLGPFALIYMVEKICMDSLVSYMECAANVLLQKIASEGPESFLVVNFKDGRIHLARDVFKLKFEGIAVQTTLQYVVLNGGTKLPLRPIEHRANEDRSRHIDLLLQHLGWQPRVRRKENMP